MALSDVLSAATVRPVYIAWFDIKDDPIRGWTGPGTLAPTGTGDDDLDDYTFDAAEGVLSVSDIVEDQGIGSEMTLTFAVSNDLGGWIVGSSLVAIDTLGPDPGGPVFNEIVKDRRPFLGRQAVVWLAFLTEDESAILPEIERIFSGVMIGCSVQRQTGQTTVISLTCDQDTQFAQMAPARLMDHQFFNTGDTATSFLNDLGRAPVAGGEKVTPGVGVGSGRGNQGRGVVNPIDGGGGGGGHRRP